MGDGTTRTEVFEDERGRALRVTWHPESAVVTVSIWNGEACVGSARLVGDDVSRLSSFLLGAWVDDLRVRLPSS